jgi:hypothetical protein
MDMSRLPEPMRRRMAEKRTDSPLAQVRDFLQSFFGDAMSLAEVQATLRMLASTNTRSIHLALSAIEQVVADPMMESELARLVGWDGNWVLEDPSNAGAKAFLQQVAGMLREVLDDAPDRWRGALDLRPPLA